MRELRPLRNMPDEMIGPLFGQLFHERMHYWQLLSYPIFQYQFLLTLECIRRTIARARGHPHGVISLSGGIDPIETAPTLLTQIQRQIDSTAAIKAPLKDEVIGRAGGLTQHLIFSMPENGLLVPFRAMRLTSAPPAGLVVLTSSRTTSPGTPSSWPCCGL
jgi:hypothetical protein